MSVFKTLRFRYRVVWMEIQPVVKLTFQISPGWCGRGQRDPKRSKQQLKLLAFSLDSIMPLSRQASYVVLALHHCFLMFKGSKYSCYLMLCCDSRSWSGDMYITYIRITRFRTENALKVSFPPSILNHWKTLALYASWTGTFCVKMSLLTSATVTVTKPLVTCSAAFRSVESSWLLPTVLSWRSVLRWTTLTFLV